MNISKLLEYINQDFPDAILDDTRLVSLSTQSWKLLKIHSITILQNNELLD